MARETQKEKIERLEKLLNNANEIINKQNEDILKMQDEADKSFNNSPEYMQMKKRIEDLELKVKIKSDSAEHNRRLYENESKTNEKLFIENQELHKLINENSKKIKNERGAGRKAKFTDEEIAMIQMYRFQGKKLQEIADMFECSIGLIHKIIHGSEKR